MNQLEQSKTTGLSKKTALRTITVEEHFATKAIGIVHGPGLDMSQMLEPDVRSAMLAKTDQLLDLGERRISDMDAAGVDVQVLSLTRGLEGVENQTEAVDLARDSNDVLADALRRYPSRFAGFAVLPVWVPEKAADELERAVKEFGFKGAMIYGHSRGRYLDDKFFWPILARAEELNVPIYLHPIPPPEPVIKASYVGNYSRTVTAVLSAWGWGWHIETALHVLRVILSGAFDVHPRLQLLIGHLGEALPFMMPRIERAFPVQVTRLNRSVGDYLRENVHYSFSGFNYIPAFLNALLQVGVDRILFSADYPYSSMMEARNFLDQLPVSQQDKEKIAHGNAERLLHL
jgi:hypothetical protein